MPEEKKPIVWMILFGVSRHLLGIAGAWLASRGLIDDDTHQRLMSEGASQLVGYALMLLPILWSVAQKFQMISWLRTAFHMNASTSSFADIPQESPTVSMPL